MVVVAQDRLGAALIKPGTLRRLQRDLVEPIGKALLSWLQGRLFPLQPLQPLPERPDDGSCLGFAGHGSQAAGQKPSFGISDVQGHSRCVDD